MEPINYEYDTLQEANDFMDIVNAGEGYPVLDGDTITYCEPFPIMDGENIIGYGVIIDEITQKYHL